MGLGSRIGDVLNMRTPIMLKTPASHKARVRQLLEGSGFTDVKYRSSGNRGLLGIQRYLDIYPRRDQHWEVWAVLQQNGYKDR